MNERQISELALRRAQAGKTLPLSAIFAALSAPVRLARAPDALTWVGGHVPGAQRAVGFWPGGREESSVLRLPADEARDLALALAARQRQKTALWFTPGTGSDVLHTLTVSARAPAVLKGLAKHGVNELTVIPGQRTTVHVVDSGGQQASAVRAYAAESGAQYSATPGTAGFANLQTRLARYWGAVLNAEDIPATGRRSARVVDHVRTLRRAMISALLRPDGTGVYALHGGTVDNNYGYPAITDASLGAASFHQDEGILRASLWTGTVTANNATIGGAVANAYGPAARPLYDDRFGSDAKRQARGVILAHHAGNINRGEHTLDVHIPDDVAHHWLLMRDNPGVFADWAEEHEHLTPEEATRARGSAEDAAAELVDKAIRERVHSRPLPRAQLARKRDRDPRARVQEFRSFMEAIQKPEHDSTAHGVFADWLREVTGNPADPRAAVVEKSEKRPHEHPDDGRYLGSIPDGAIGPPWAYQSKAFRLANGLSMDVVGGYPLPSHPVQWGQTVHREPTHAIVRWRVPVPPAPGEKVNRGSYHTFSARFEPHELHALIDQLPEPHQTQWRAYAERYGLKKS